MIRKLWVKFDDENDIECMCEDGNRKCLVYPGGKLPCKEYVVKFVEIDRSEEEAIKKIKDFGDAVKKFEKDLQKKIKDLNKFKVR